jgi:EAL domain-containing protein (putative c-di-GMP-specific phosphodiesterase class I)
LKEHGCDHVQGYLFSPAVPAPEFARFLDDASPALRLPPPVLEPAL